MGWGGAGHYHIPKLKYVPGCWKMDTGMQLLAAVMTLHDDIDIIPRSE